MIAKCFVQTLPVFMGYLPLGIAFGIVYASLHLEWYYGVLSALLIFTAAGQFLLISLLSAHAGLLEIAIAAFLLNIRHLFYALSIVQEIKQFGIGKYYVLFGLTDETFALLKSGQLELDAKHLEKHYVCITLFNHVYWVAGCGLGIVLGGIFPIHLQGAGFILTALFSVLTLGALWNSPIKSPFYISCVIGVLGLIIFPKDGFLLLSILCGIGILLGFKAWIIRR